MNARFHISIVFWRYRTMGVVWWVVMVDIYELGSQIICVFVASGGGGRIAWAY